MTLNLEGVLRFSRDVVQLQSFPIFCTYLLMVFLCGFWKKVASPLSLKPVSSYWTLLNHLYTDKHDVYTFTRFAVVTAHWLFPIKYKFYIYMDFLFICRPWSSTISLAVVWACTPLLSLCTVYTQPTTCTPDRLPHCSHMCTSSTGSPSVWNFSTLSSWSWGTKPDRFRSCMSTTTVVWFCSVTMPITIPPGQQ